MRHWFELPQRDDEYESFAARVLHYTLLVLLCIAVLFAFFVSSPVQLIFLPFSIGIFGGSYYLLHRGRFHLASGIFITCLWLVITVASFSINGVRNASMSSYAIVIIFTALFFTDRGVLVITTLTIASAVILTLGEILQVLPIKTTELFLADRFFQLVALYSAAGILLAAAGRVIRSSLERTRQTGTALVQRNAELEAEIAERRRIESDLRLSEEKYRLLFENISAMASVYGEDGEIILLNKASAEVYGGTPESLIGRNMRDVLAPEDATFAIQRQAEVMETGIDDLSEGHVVIPGGRELVYLRHIMPLPDSNGSQAKQVLVLTTDLKEQYQAQQQKRALALAEEKNALLTEFFSTLSHDLKTPLSVMKTSLYLLERMETAQQRQEKISRIDEQVGLMETYIQDMLTISRLEYLPLLNFQEIHLNDLIAQVLNLLRPRIESKSIDLQFISEPNLPPVHGDQEQLQRMLMNLIENAINYTGREGRVIVKTYVKDQSSVLDIEDSGIGIEAEALPHIFERFFRTNKARSYESNGSGLGLAIVKKIVESHSATIEVNSQLNQGTRFSVQFPTESMETPAI